MATKEEAREFVEASLTIEAMIYEVHFLSDSGSPRRRLAETIIDSLLNDEEKISSQIRALEPQLAGIEMNSSAIFEFTPVMNYVPDDDDPEVRSVAMTGHGAASEILSSLHDHITYETSSEEEAIEKLLSLCHPPEIETWKLIARIGRERAGWMHAHGLFDGESPTFVNRQDIFYHISRSADPKSKKRVENATIGYPKAKNKKGGCDAFMVKDIIHRLIEDFPKTDWSSWK